MKIRQLSVFLENRPGRLSALCRTLADAGVNLSTLTLAETGEFGLLRLITPDPDKARQVVERAGYAATMTEVVALQVPDRPGGLATVLSALESSGISVEYMYAFAMRAAGIDADSLEAIYMVGGSSILPLVPKMVAERFPKARRVITDKPFSSTAMGAAIHSVDGVRLHDILGRTFGVVRVDQGGTREYFSTIFPAGTPLPKRGRAPLQHIVQYVPQHNIGHLRYLECSLLDKNGWPSEGIRPWSDVVFPYDPRLQVAGALRPQSIEVRPDLGDQRVTETYACDSDGVVTVTIRRDGDGQSLSCEIFRLREK